MKSEEEEKGGEEEWEGGAEGVSWKISIRTASSAVLGGQGGAFLPLLLSTDPESPGPCFAL